MGSERGRKLKPAVTTQPPTEQEMPEWLEQVRLTVESKVPLMRTLTIRAISAVLKLDLSVDSMVNATSAPTDMVALLRALSSEEILDDLRTVEPLAPAFIRGILAKRQLIDEHGGALSSDKVAKILGITRQAVDKRRSAGTLIGLTLGGHNYQYPVWQFAGPGILPGLGDVLRALAPHDEWMQVAFFVSKNPRLGDRTPIEVLKAGHLRDVLDAAQNYGEHGAT